MSAKCYCLLLAMLGTVAVLHAQNKFTPARKSLLVYGQKPAVLVQPPQRTRFTDATALRKPGTYLDSSTRRLVRQTPDAGFNHLQVNGAAPAGKKDNLQIGLTRDLNLASSSYPSNNPINQTYRYAVLNNVSYFFANDGIHGRELWRSDGTAGGTYMVKDI